YLESDPSWTADGSGLVYSSDQAGSPDLWQRDLRTGRTTRLTRLPGAEIAPAVAEDGTIAYQDQVGATYVLEANGAARAVDAPRWLPGHPSWAPDSRHLALSVVEPFSDRFREGTSQILTIDTATGAQQLIEPAPYRSLSTRGVDGPVWSPDGDTVAFVTESRLYTMPVDSTGRPTGEPVAVTNEVTDAPSFSGDSGTLLYLSNGRLRTVPADGSETPRTVPMDLDYRPEVHTGRVVVHAGALWDGTSDRLRRNVDVVVQGHRITAVRDHDPDAHHGRVVDASDQTVMPGLLDTHIHNGLWGKAFGSRKGRLYLAYGVTTARSLGDPAYDALEDAESYRAGTQAGPRFFPTGEAIDGSRVYYDFMRPTLDETQLRRLELARARGLSYDMVKAYVRLPADLNRIVVAAAHMMGVPNLSHYIYPGIAYGQDGQSHISATQRLGYSRSQSLGGVTYDDAVELFANSKTTVIPTLFDSSTLFAEDDSVLTDQRTAELMPAWYYQTFADEAARAGSTDQSVVRRHLRLEVEALRRIIENGGVVAAGTDAPLDQVGLSTHMNLRAMVRYGLSEQAALRSATSVAARVLGEADDLGTVEAGKLADLVAVNGNPLTDISTTDDVEFVMKGGETWTVEQLLRPYADKDGSALAQRVSGLTGAPDKVLARLPRGPRIPEHAH
ncbi:MAG: amidohydrolase family protein, partial [Actinomycetota bacterium]|nr:amidohydrolase family protein [Actinomycetota bacterium]